MPHFISPHQLGFLKRGWLPASTFNEACCVTHLYLYNSNQQER
ncbi:MAG: hypothetical protein JWQ96_868, partial [Segetibacter sp.]|nr:hypothetical protein [Segetibacter sp.]